MVKRVVLLGALVMALMLLPASSFAATSVTYSTSGLFSGTDANGAGTQLQNGPNALNFAKLTFTAQSSTTVSAPTGISLGTLTASALGTGGTFGGTDAFQLTISQTAPGSQSGISSTSISGTITSTSNGIVVNFSPQTLTLAGILYTLNTNFFLVAPNTNGGETSLQASITPVVPEPASLLLFGSGLTGLAGVVRRRLKK